MYKEEDTVPVPTGISRNGIEFDFGRDLVPYEKGDNGGVGRYDCGRNAKPFATL